MDKNTLVRESLKLIRKDFGLATVPALETVDNPVGRLREFLTAQIRQLLDHDLHQLLNAMYRIDIPERRLREILELADPDKIASDLAEAVIGREFEKIRTRSHYSSKKF